MIASAIGMPNLAARITDSGEPPTPTRSEIPPPEVQQAQKTQLYKQMIDAAPLGFVPSQLPGNNYGFKTPKQWEGVEQLRKAGGLLTKTKAKK